jgi:hypothetical protein
MMFSFVRLQKQAQITAILDLFWEDGQLNVYRGELEVRPPDAPTTGPDTKKRGRWVSGRRRAYPDRPTS